MLINQWLSFSPDDTELQSKVAEVVDQWYQTDPSMQERSMFEEHLLAIEDDVYIASLIAEVAKEAGYYSHTLCNSAELSDAYASIGPHVIVLDILMPDVDGFDVLNFLADQQSKSQIVILSGSHEYRDMAEKMGSARGLSIVANIGKPFRVNELRMALQEIRFQTQNDRVARVATS